MRHKDKYYIVTEIINGEAVDNILQKEKAEKLYRKIRARGGKAYIRVYEPIKIRDINVSKYCKDK